MTVELLYNVRFDVVQEVELFYYDESSPSCLRRNTDWVSGKEGCTVRAKAGDVTGSLNEEGYWTVFIDGKLVKAHNVVWELHNGSIPEGHLIDHFDGDQSNNRIDNLRSIPEILNTRNKRKYSNNTSGETGVLLIRGKWLARWHDLNGERKTKSFTVTKYGNDEAFRLACEYRQKMIDELNAQGAGYTERHGN